MFRAGSVLVSGNRIADCAFSAIRSNSGSNCQMIGNSCARLGEVALYAEFAFEGAVIANNLVDKAATGISVTNFNEGGRLAVVQGNLIRNLFIRKDADARGIGIAVEADSVVSGNVIEGSPGFGIMIGWGPLSARRERHRQSDPQRPYRHRRLGRSRGGPALITDNLISGAKDGGDPRHERPDAGRSRPRSRQAPRPIATSRSTPTSPAKPRPGRQRQWQRVLRGPAAAPTLADTPSDAA